VSAGLAWWRRVVAQQLAAVASRSVTESMAFPFSFIYMTGRRAQLVADADGVAPLRARAAQLFGLGDDAAAARVFFSHTPEACVRWRRGGGACTDWPSSPRRRVGLLLAHARGLRPVTHLWR